MPPARQGALGTVTLQTKLLLGVITGAWIALLLSGLTMISRADAVPTRLPSRQAIPTVGTVLHAMPHTGTLPPHAIYVPMAPLLIAYDAAPVPATSTLEPAPRLPLPRRVTLRSALDQHSARGPVLRARLPQGPQLRTLPAGEPVPAPLPADLRADTDRNPARAGARQGVFKVPGLTFASAVGPAQAAVGQRTSQVWVTGYSLSGTTATGITSGPGICAVDPSFIPLGTKITIEHFGACLAADTGPAVIGAHIDVWVPTDDQAYGLTGWYTIRW